MVQNSWETNSKGLIVKLAIAIFILSSVTAVAGFSDWSSSTLWEKMSEKQNSVTGVVKGIALDDSSDKIFVKVETKSSGVQVLPVCLNSVVGTADLDIQNQLKMSLLKQSLKNGDKLTFGYNSEFDKCIRRLSLLAN